MLATLLVQYNPDGSLVFTDPYAEAQIKLGRQPFSYVELDLDFCANTFGVAPCTATGSGDAKCYNTYASCQDTANFNKITKTYRFCSPNGARVPYGLDAIPCLKSINITPAEITAGQGLGLRAACSVSFQDFPHSDIRIDPYVTERTYKPIERGTFFGKLKARNPYYNGRIMRVYNGYLNDDGSFDVDNFERRTFVIEQWNGIDPNGITQITGKDILKLASDERAVCPSPSVGKITLDMTTGTTSINLTPTGVGSDYDASGYVRIGQEVMSYTRSGDTLTIVRGQKGTIAATHRQGDTVQLCKQFSGQTSQDIVYDLLVNFANVDTVFINKPDWDAEQVAYLPRLYNTLITTPTGISKLLSELSEQVGFFLFWDEVDELIKFQTIRPNSPSETVKQLSSEYNLIADSLKTVDIVSDRVNEVWVYYGIIDHAKNLTDDANYSNLYIASNVGDQSAVRNNDIRIKKIVTRWITDGAAATELGQRYLERFALSPIQADFMLDAKDSSIKLCDFVELTSKQNQGFDGSPVAILMQVVKRLERQTGTTWAFTARQFAFSTYLNPVRPIEIDGSNPSELFDLDLKAAHDAQFAPATTGTVIKIIIKSGVLVSASSTANYALTNPSTWASGVIINLIIESGAVVAGLGGDAGDGAKVFGGDFTPPTDGKKGGNGVLILSDININNLGIIASGGGGGGGGGIVTTAPPFSYAITSGGGGGGGAPHGTANNYGLGGDYPSQPNSENGQNATATIGGVGGLARHESGTLVAGSKGGKGGDLAQAGEDGYYDTSASTGVVIKGIGGAAGDYAVNGNSFITWTATGTIYGAII